MNLTKSQLGGLIFFGIIVLFFTLRIPGVHQPYHQDEYKWPKIVSETKLTEEGSGGIPHPPLGEFIYSTTYKTVGRDNFRIVPFVFGFLNLLLLFAITRKMYGAREALWVAGVFSISFFSVLASLMVDTDGQILPFFFLLSVLGLQNWFGEKRKWGIALALLALFLGVLVKLSFGIAVVAICVWVLYEYRKYIDIKKGVGISIGAVLLFGLGVYTLSHLSALFPFFNFEWSLTYWKSFLVSFGDRNFFQSGIQVTKALFYTSPLLLLPIFLAKKEDFRKLLVFWVFILFAFLFYLVVFDFSGGALDRYMQFLIVPLSLFAGVVYTRLFSGGEVTFWGVVSGSVFLTAIFSVQFVPHAVIALHPKTAWIEHATSFKWNILFPFSGGSGPLGFYVSLLFITMSWIVAIILVTFLKVSPKKKFAFGALLFSVGLLYNAVFMLEYHSGFSNGSARELLQDVVTYIDENEDIKYVTVYNDNGGNEIQKIGKYRKRLYTDPAFDIRDKVNTLNTYKEHYLEIDIPRIDPESVYRSYLDSCEVVYRETSGKISATVYDCRTVPDIEI